MDIREKNRTAAGVRLPRTTIPAEFAALVREYKIGNVILFRYNIENLPQLARLCADIQELIRGATGRDAFITIDQEGGMVTRLPWDAVNVPGSMALAATGKPENAVLAAEITARQLRGVGVNFNLAPDLDVNSNPMNPVIGVRSFGDNPQSVALFGTKRPWRAIKTAACSAAASISPATATPPWIPTSGFPASRKRWTSLKRASSFRSARRSRRAFPP